MNNMKQPGETAGSSNLVTLDKRRAMLEAKQSALSKHLQELRKRLDGNSAD